MMLRLAGMEWRRLMRTALAWVLLAVGLCLMSRITSYNVCYTKLLRLQQQLQASDALTSPAETRRYLQARLRHYPHEVFACLFLRITSYNVCYTKLLREVPTPAFTASNAVEIFGNMPP